MSRVLVLLGLLFLPSCVDIKSIPDMPGDRCHSDLNFAYCHVVLKTKDGPQEVIVSGSTVLSAFGAGITDVVGGASAHSTLAK